jgi:hypothetical protein
MSEIVIVYGKSELKQSELEWIKEIPDLKLYEKSNLHAKVYLNEEKAIICSMNLYDYSQMNNIEMGLLITKKEDEEAFASLIDEINNIKINGLRIQLDKLASEISTDQEQKYKEPISDKANTPIIKTELSLEQKTKFQILKKWRLYKSKFEHLSAHQILTDDDIKALVTTQKLDKSRLFEMLPKKNALKFAAQILEELDKYDKYTVGQITNVSYQDDVGKYDKVKLKISKTGEEKWFDTTYELPIKNKFVAVKLNDTWFNEYFYID